MLTLHFTNLRLLWCQSSHGTAALFRDLKRGAPQPDVDKALTITSTDSTNKDVKYNVTAHDSLMKLPSISTKNIYTVADHVENITSLAAMSLEDLSDLLSNKREADSIFSFLNTEYVPEVNDEKSETSRTRPNKQSR